MGDKVSLDYTGKLDDGSIFDTSKHENHSHPLEFVAGIGQVIPGFDNAIIGMSKGEKKTFTLKPEQAYGERDEKLIVSIEKEKFPKEGVPKVGMLMAMRMKNGEDIPAIITEIKEKVVMVDLNHPLAGKNLTFEIEVKDVQKHKTSIKPTEKPPVKK